MNIIFISVDRVQLLIAMLAIEITPCFEDRACIIVLTDMCIFMLNFIHVLFLSSCCWGMCSVCDDC